MRLKHVNVRVLLSSLLAVLALSAVAASAAQASVEGPFFKDGATRLLEGESKEVKVKNASQTFRMSVSTLGIGLGCGKVGVASGAKLLGSTGANSATGEATLEFSECRWEGSQAQCKITGEAFKTKLLKLELAYPGDARSGDIEVLLKPAKGSEFADVKSTGECFWPEMNIEGSTIAELEANDKPEMVYVGKRTGGGQDACNRVLSSRNRESNVIDEGALAGEHEMGTDAGGTALSILGRLEAELAGGANWGVFS